MTQLIICMPISILIKSWSKYLITVTTGREGGERGGERGGEGEGGGERGGERGERGRRREGGGGRGRRREGGGGRGRERRERVNVRLLLQGIRWCAVLRQLTGEGERKKEGGRNRDRESGKRAERIRIGERERAPTHMQLTLLNNILEQKTK